MEYTKQTWTAPTGTGLSRYAKSAESASHVTLTLDPVNLTNTPTPFTAERMAHIEEGIAKAYDTAPPTPWAQYSGKDIPQLPDNLAGTTQKVTEFTSIPSGWVVNAGAPVSSFDDNEWQVVCNSGGEGYVKWAPAGSIVLMYIKCISGSMSMFDPVIGNIKNYSASDKWNLFIYYVPTARNIGHYSSSSTYRIKSIYIGTGAYDRLVFDNSYHYRHLLNNAVIPTPQGLYFNGATSYLRSKEKITLPDVFTFSATVNCAVSTTSYQRIFEVYNNATSFLRVYRSPNTNSISVSFYNTSSASAEYRSVSNFFVDNIDIDTKIEIDFINKVIKVYKNNILVYNATTTGIQKPTEEYLYIGGSGLLDNFLLGYMRNICLFDTSLTDTQRNWLAQGNTPPILYDVTNHETEGYVSIQDADGTNTGIETDVDSNGNRILKLPATIKANVTGNLTGNVTGNLTAIEKANFGDAGLVNATGTTDAVTGTPSKSAYFPNLYNKIPVPTWITGELVGIFYKAITVGNRIVAVGSSKMGYSDDKGITWTYVTTTVLYRTVTRLEHRLIAAGSNKIAISDNYGNSWTESTLAGSWNGSTTTVNNRIVLVGNNKIAYSDNSGTTWTPLTVSVKYFDVIEIDGRLVAAGEGKVAYSDNSGTSWTEIVSSGTNTSIAKIESRLIMSSGYGIKYSDNKGETWTYVSTVGHSMGAITIIGRRIVIAGTGGGYNYSDDKGLTWEKHSLSAVLNSLVVIGERVVGVGNNIKAYTDNAFAGLLADKLATARKIGSVDFDGSADITIEEMGALHSYKGSGYPTRATAPCDGNGAYLVASTGSNTETDTRTATYLYLVHVYNGTVYPVLIASAGTYLGYAEPSISYDSISKEIVVVQSTAYYNQDKHISILPI